MPKPKPALQLYTMRFVAKEEGLETALKQCAEAGYNALETSDLFADNDPATVKALFKELGFVSAGLHTGFGALGDLAAAIKFLKEMKSPYLIVSGVGDHQAKGLAAYDEAAEKFNEVGRQLADEGMVLCYHNHSWEFKDYGASTGIARLYEATDPKLVKGCIDTYWVRHGGDDPVAFIKRYSNRLAILHMKDFNDGKFADLGDGEIDFPTIIALGEQFGAEWATVENDQPRDPAIESIKTSRRYMKETLGI